MRSSPSFVIYVHWQPDGYRKFTASSIVLGILKKSPNISNKAQMLAKAQEISSLWLRCGLHSPRGLNFLI
jgi:hypothetical protein